MIPCVIWIMVIVVSFLLGPDPPIETLGEHSYPSPSGIYLAIFTDCGQGITLDYAKWTELAIRTGDREESIVIIAYGPPAQVIWLSDHQLYVTLRTRPSMSILRQALGVDIDYHISDDLHVVSLRLLLEAQERRYTS